MPQRSLLTRTLCYNIALVAFTSLLLHSLLSWIAYVMVVIYDSLAYVVVFCVQLGIRLGHMFLFPSLYL